MKIFTAIASALGSFIALTASGACWITWFDEPTMPESLIK